MKCEYTRHANRIKTLATGEVKQYATTNEAKRASKKIQIVAGRLGCGILRLVPRL